MVLAENLLLRNSPVQSLDQTINGVQEMVT